MAETKESRNSRSESKENSESLAGQERNRGTLQRRDAGALTSPFEFVNRMAEEMDRTFDRMFRDFGMPQRSWFSRMPFRFGGRESLWSPRIEAFQKEDQFVVRAELPGLKKDDVQVDLTDEAITIQGDRQEEHKEEREGYYHTERQYGHFYRSIPVPEGAITENAHASFKNGVLEISMPAPPAQARSRRLEIKETSASDEKQ